MEPNKTIGHEDVIEFMSLVAERNRAGIEQKLAELSGALDNQTGGEARAFSSIIKGLSSFLNNQYGEARAHFQPVMEKEKLSLSIRGVALMGIGFTCRSMGSVDEAVVQLTAASECIDPKGRFRSFLAYCYQQLGDIHTSIHENEVALQYFEKAYGAAGRATEGLAYFRYHMGLGHCYLGLKDYAKSEEHYHKALQVKNIPSNVIAKIENDLGTLYMETRQFEQAEKLLQSSLAVREASKLEDAVCTTMTNLAEVYLEQGRTDEAFRLLERCSQLVEKYDTKAKKLQVLKLLAQANRLVGNSDKAIDYYEQYIALFDSLKREQERNIFKFKNKQIEKQKQTIADKHQQLTETFNEIKRLKVNRKAALFSWITIIILVVISELLIDPLIENYSYNTLLSLLLKVGIALLFKPLDGLYENILWKRTLRHALV
jgi:tetratricopeptide (TPR) repeat protein